MTKYEQEYYSYFAAYSEKEINFVLESIVTSKTRIQILLRFFLNPDRKTYLRELANELGESTNGIRVELNRLANARLIESTAKGRTKYYQANIAHPLFPDLHNIVKKTLGIDKLIEGIINRLGNMKLAFITGDYALGIDSGIIDLVIVGDINKDFLNQLIDKTEKLIGGRKIRCLCLLEGEFINLKGKLRENGILEIYAA